MAPVSQKEKANLFRSKLVPPGITRVKAATGSQPRPLPLYTSIPSKSGITDLDSLKVASQRLREERRADDRPDKEVTAAGFELVTSSLTRLYQRENPAGVSGISLQALIQRTANSYRKSSTFDSYAHSCNRWVRHCELIEVTPFPINPWILADFLAHEILRLAAGNFSASSLRNTRSALKKSAELANEQDPYDHVVTRVMHEAGLRELGFKNQSKAPIYSKHVREAVHQFGGPDASLQCIQHLMLLALSFEGALRWDDLKSIRLGDLLHSDEMIRIFLCSSKTDAFAEGQWSAILPSQDPWSAHVLIDRYIMCVLSTWDNALTQDERGNYAPWRDEQGLLRLTEVPLVTLWNTTESGHVFPAPGARTSSAGSCHSWGLTPTEASKAYNAYNCRLKSWAPALGLDPTTIGTHSPRRGLVSETINCGLAETFAKVQGRWRSDKGFRRYIDDEVALRKHAQGLQQFYWAVAPQAGPPPPLSPSSALAAHHLFELEEDRDLRSASPMNSAQDFYDASVAVAAVAVLCPEDQA